MEDNIIGLDSYKGSNIEKGFVNDLEKGGEGSRGGKVFGHTKSGKPIYIDKHPKDYKGYSNKDHSDAEKLHHSRYLELKEKHGGNWSNNSMEKQVAEYHRSMGVQHSKLVDDDAIEEESKHTKSRKALYESGVKLHSEHAEHFKKKKAELEAFGKEHGGTGYKVDTSHYDNAIKYHEKELKHFKSKLE